MAALLPCSRDNSAGTMLLQYDAQSSQSITEEAMIWPPGVHELQHPLSHDTKMGSCLALCDLFCKPSYRPNQPVGVQRRLHGVCVPPPWRLPRKPFTQSQA
jgi:hypothetical protein